MIGFSYGVLIMCFVYSRLRAEFYIDCCSDRSFAAIQINDVETESIVHVVVARCTIKVLKWSDLTI
jgi:hypothetical protein